MISVNDVHLLNAFLPIEVTDEGTVICFNDEHPLNMQSKIFCILPLITNDFIPLNAQFPIEVTEEGIVICSNDEQPSNVEYLIEYLIN